MTTVCSAETAIFGHPSLVFSLGLLVGMRKERLYSFVTSAFDRLDHCPYKLRSSLCFSTKALLSIGASIWARTSHCFLCDSVYNTITLAPTHRDLNPFKQSYSTQMLP